jgi:hypothetical protein
LRGQLLLLRGDNGIDQIHTADSIGNIRHFRAEIAAVGSPPWTFGRI